MIQRYTIKTNQYHWITAIILLIYDESSNTYYITKNCDWHMIIRFIEEELNKNIEKNKVITNAYNFYSTIETIDVILGFDELDKSIEEKELIQRLEDCIYNLCEMYDLYYEKKREGMKL